MTTWDRGRARFHGTPLDLAVLKAGSSVTQHRDLARVFSHKPTVVSISDDGEMMHNGQRPGILYRLANPIAEDDVEPHPRSAMPSGLEWVTTRDLSLVMIESTEVRPGELLTDLDTARLMRSHPELATPDEACCLGSGPFKLIECGSHFRPGNILGEPAASRGDGCQRPGRLTRRRSGRGHPVARVGQEISADAPPR